MKYPLTDTARKAATTIVDAWKSGELEQELTITVSRGDDKTEPGFVYGASNNLQSPSFATWWELSKFGLVDAQQGDNAWDILLLQELRNAVENDFEVSDYFITMNAVGNIIVNSTTGPVQGVGHNRGVLHQNVEQLADYMTAQLGEYVLQTEIELKAAIDALRDATIADQQSKLGKVISELGNCLEHGANTAAVVAALTAAAPFIQRLVGG